MGVYFQPEDDGLTMRESGRWVAEKLDYLKRYIDVFETSMRNKWPRRCYIDLFAGPGKCRCRETGAIHLGSPLLALSSEYPFTDYVFVDSDPATIDTLKQRCQASPYFGRIQFIVGDANQSAAQVVQYLQGIPSLNLAFLDPEGLELHWNTVAMLARISRLDLIIHYSQMGLSRLMPVEIGNPMATIVDKFFGDDQWRAIYLRYSQGEEQFLHRQLMDHYKRKLLGLGYQKTRDVGDEPLMRNAKNAPPYRLLFASKHPLGHDFWRKVVGRDVHGQKRLF